MGCVHSAAQGLSHKHVDSLHAADEVLDLAAARDVYTRRGEGVSIWIVPSAAIRAGDPDRAAETFDLAADKISTRPTFCAVPDDLGAHVMRHPDVILPLAGDRLIIGHRISEWCGHGPMLEKVLALPKHGAGPDRHCDDAS